MEWASVVYTLDVIKRYYFEVNNENIEDDFNKILSKVQKQNVLSIMTLFR